VAVQLGVAHDDIVPPTGRSVPRRPTENPEAPNFQGGSLYIGGMGAKQMNFHFDVFARMGYEEAATKSQDAYLDGRKDDAAAAVPTAMVEDIALVGPVEKIRDDLDAWRESRATTMLINGDLATLRTMAELVLGRDTAGPAPGYLADRADGDRSRGLVG
jgi:hypothetical protein